MIKIEREPEEITKEFRGILEHCVFCKKTTPFWSFKPHRPVCEACAKKKTVKELIEKEYEKLPED